MIHATVRVGRSVCCSLLGGALIVLFLSFFTLGTTPLHFAARWNWPKAIEVMAVAGAPMDAPGATILHAEPCAKVQSGSTCIEWMFRVVAPLHLAAHFGHVDATKALLLAGAPIEATRAGGSGDSRETPLHVAALEGNHAVVEVLAAAGASLEAKTNGRAATPLHLAAKGGHSTALDVLVAAGASLEAHTETWETPLHMAAQGGHVAVIEALVLAGASLEAQTHDGETPLHAAAARGHTKAIRSLISAGASLEAQAGWQMYTPLHAAAKEGAVKAIEALVAAGASFEAQTKRGVTPLHVAASRGHAKAVEALLAAGSSPEARTDEGATPLVEASARGHAGVVSALEAASSQTNASCDNSAPTEELPPQLPQTFDEWYAITHWTITPRLWEVRARFDASPWWWFHHGCEDMRWLLAAWSYYKYWPLQIQAPGSLPSWIDSLKASLLASALSMVAFAVQSTSDPCIIALVLDDASFDEGVIIHGDFFLSSYWTPVCAWNPSDESMLAHAKVDPSAVAGILCVPALTLFLLCRLCWLGNSACLALTNMFGVGARGSLRTLRRLWAVFPVRRLATRPRLRLSLRLLALCCISWCWFLWICSTSPPMSLFMCAVLGVALDVEWWVVERPSAGICLAAAFFPTHTAVYACVSVAVVSLHLIEPLVQAVKLGLVAVLPGEGELPDLGWVDELGWAILRANIIWRLFIELCIDNAVDRMAPAALIERAMNLDTFPGNRPKHWPPSLIIPEALDNLNRDDGTPREFVCPLTMGLMRQPAVTPQGTTYDFEAIASWVDARGRYPANESPELLSRPELAPNRVLRSMIEEWVAARSTAS